MTDDHLFSESGEIWHFTSNSQHQSYYVLAHSKRDFGCRRSGRRDQKSYPDFLFIDPGLSRRFFYRLWFSSLYSRRHPTARWLGSFGTLLGAAVFPVGIILTVLAGGELLTGNMMLLPVAWFARQISALSVMRNWFWVTLANFIGSVTIAWFFGHMLGMTEGDYLKKTVAVASAKVNADFLHAFISGVGCNWLVCLATWIAFASKDVVGKIFGMWFPIMAFVAIGFQHVVANMFIVPAAIFAGYLSWAEYLPNFVAVFLGNAVGGAIFVGLAYFVAYRAPQPESSVSR